RAERDLKLAQEKAADMLRETKQSAAEIIEKANKTANEIVEEAKQQARAEGERLLASAKTEIDLEVNRVKEDLRNQVSVLAVAGAEKILGATVDAKAHNNLVEQLAAEL
ncbi:MAG: F0F1 ATP synthase subunit B, partial [Thiopseudomonas sp.]